jgi:hypothetical protein
MRFILFVEGYAEKRATAAFFKRWLDPQLSSPVGIKTVNLKANTNFAREIRKRVHFHLEQDRRGEIIQAIGLLDLFRGANFPAGMTAADERYNWGVDHYQNLVQHDKFRMFFAVHEFEAWILSDPSVLPRAVRDMLPRNINPEAVNFEEPPARLLDSIYRSATSKGYKKTTHGANLFARLEPEAVRKACPYLRLMLDEMLSMAKRADL